jgi:hypothetical protein
MYITCNNHNVSIRKTALATPPGGDNISGVSHRRPSWRLSLVANVRHVERPAFDEGLQTV